MIEKENFYRLLSIDAWRDPYGGWEWNNWFTMEEDIYIPSEAITPRCVFKMLRNGYLSDYSKGRVRLEDDGYNLVIKDRHTGKPIFALEPQWPM